jgi:AMMECR1 domain-containing protein
VEHPYVQLARESLRHYLTTGHVLPAPDRTPPACGVFVSLHEGTDGPLRGCVGSIRPGFPTLDDEVAHQAVNAAAHDPRFSPVGLSELDGLQITVYLLDTPTEVRDLSELDPAKYGVIVEGPRGRRGLLLPDIPGIDTAYDQVKIARRKARIGADEPIRLLRFAATILH